MGGVVRKSRLKLLRLPDWEFLTYEEVANILDVSPRQVRRWGSDYGLPLLKLSPHCVRVNVGDLRRWMKSRRVVSRKK